MTRAPHQYVDRDTAQVRTERFVGDRLLHLSYRDALEHPGTWLKLLTSRRASHVLGALNYDVPRRTGALAASLGIDLAECVERPSRLGSARRLFERQIRYWDVRPMDRDRATVVSPADARVLLGSLTATSLLFLKGKFFDLDELLGAERAGWRKALRDADVAIFRLTPDKYHYNHAPVTGVVRDVYEVAGDYHSCNPGPVTAIATPYSKNRRVVTIVDTDVPDGTGVGLVAMIEVVALMVGQIEQCYSATRYDDPRPVVPGLVLSKGQPKSLFRPGSSTDVLLFERGRVDWSGDLIANTMRVDVQSRFSLGFGRALVETDVRVRATIGRRAPRRQRRPDDDE